MTLSTSPATLTDRARVATQATSALDNESEVLALIYCRSVCDLASGRAAPCSSGTRSCHEGPYKHCCRPPPLDRAPCGPHLRAAQRCAHGRLQGSAAHARPLLAPRAGEIVESGPHDELMSRDGVYAALVRAQELSDTRGDAVAEHKEPLLGAAEAVVPSTAKTPLALEIELANGAGGRGACHCRAHMIRIVWARRSRAAHANANVGCEQEGVALAATATAQSQGRCVQGVQGGR